MPELDDSALLHRAREAVGRCEWHLACNLLLQADAGRQLDGEDLVLLATTAYASGHVDLTIEAWERTHTNALARGDRHVAAAAAARVALHLLFDTALLAPIRGWVMRAERLLAGQGDTPVHAWIAVVRSYERLLSGDLDRALEWARRAIVVGTVYEPTAAALGRVAEARAVILKGDVVRGLDLLNEAAVTAVSGEIDPLSTGVVYCEVVCAMQAVAQYDLAEQWTEAMERWRHGHPVGSIHGRCRLHRAEILRLRGSCDEAEREALRACEELRPYLRREFGWPLKELGQIRLRRGDVSGAEAAFLEAQQSGWDPQPGLALVRLAQGDTERAVSLIRDAIDHPVSVPSKEFPPHTDLRRAPLLEAQVEIEIAAGEIARAREAADELTRIAALFESAALKAAAAVARGRVHLAAGEPAAAREHFAMAAPQWEEIGAPYETAVARTELAHAFRAEGNEARAALELGAASAIFERMGARSRARRVAGLVQAAAAAPAGTTEPPIGVAAAVIDGTRGRTEFHCEGDYWAVVFAGRTSRVRDAKGLRYLARLLAAPGREFHVLDLVAQERAPDRDPTRDAARGAASRAGNDAGEILDARAKEAYRRRLSEIDDDAQQARELGDMDRVEQALAEREFLARELAGATGLGGRDRRFGSAAERARASVTRAIRLAMGRIRTHHPELGSHLDRAIRTGTYCVYLPDARVPIEWKS